MASITTAGDQARSVAKPAPKQDAAAVQVDAPSRREFLYYIWLASIALFSGQLTAGIIWFSLPRFKEGTFGGVFNFPVDKFPVVPGAAPSSEPAGRFHVIYTADEGLLVLYGVCTHLGCLPKWQVSGTSELFQCPCHGSQYTLNGNWIAGPAPRGLDIFETTVTFEDGTSETTADGGDLEGAAYAIKLNGRRLAKIEVNTGERIKRPNHG
jgi:cytochrome b6-f complex iron-sulfur subunit